MRLIPGVCNHVQNMPSDAWAVKHNLGGNGSKGVPIVDVTVIDDGKVQKLMPAGVEIVDKDNLIIRFSVPRRGSATIIA